MVHEVPATMTNKDNATASICQRLFESAVTASSSNGPAHRVRALYLYPMLNVSAEHDFVMVYPTYRTDVRLPALAPGQGKESAYLNARLLKQHA